MAGKLASLIIKIAADGASAEKELKKLERTMSNWSKNIKKIGTDMSKYITAPITAMAGVSVAAANTQLQAEAKLLNALQGRSDVQQRLIAQAAELQSRSTLGDEAIIEQQAYLTVLGLSEKQIGATIEAAAQLSSALNMDLSSAVKNLGKTFGGMTGELGESIPALKNLTERQLRAGEAVNYVNQKYRGFAETAASIGTGPLTQLKNIIGDIAESFGVILLPTIQKIAAKLKEMATAFQQLSPEIKETIVNVVAIAAVIGPTVVAVSKLVTIVKFFALALPIIKATLASMVTPIGLLTTAVVALGNSWLNARKRMQEYTKEAEESAKGHWDKTVDVKVDFIKSKNFTDDQLDYLISTTRNRISEYEAEGKDTYQIKATYVALVKVKKERVDQAKITEEQVDAQTDLNDAIDEQVGLIDKLTEKIEALEKAKKSATSEAEIKRINTELSATKAELDKLNSLGEIKIVPTIEKPEGFKELGLADGDDLLSLEPIVNYTTRASQQMSAFWENLKNKAQQTSDVMKDIVLEIERSIENIIMISTEGLGNMWSGIDVDPFGKFLGWLGETLKKLGSILISYAVTMQAFKEALGDIFMNPWLALGVGAAAIALGQKFVNEAQKTPKLANGGLAYGPTLAVVGDNRGAAADPEVIAPLSKLRNYIGGQQMELVGGVAFELRGDVARAILNRENVRLNRKG